MASSNDKSGHLLEDYLSHCPRIPEGANYWFFRTEAGSLFEPFITSNCIAIGYPSIELRTLLALSSDKEDKIRLSRQIKASIPTEERPGLAARQLLIFAHEMKGGDFVIIPSENTRELAIGVISDKPPVQGKLTFQGQVYENHTKKRNVRWLKRVPREAVNPNLYKILFAHQTVSNVTACAPWIDTLLYDFFKKGNRFHYVLDVTRKDGINARDLFEANIDLFQLADEFAAQMDITVDSRAIDTRINLNSPGSVELITPAAEFIFVVAAMVIAINGGGLKFKVERFGIDLNISTDGLIKNVNKFLNDRKNRQLSDSVKTKLDSLQVESSDDIVKMIDHINKGNK